MKRYIHSIGIIYESINQEAQKIENFIPILLKENSLHDSTDVQFADLPPQSFYEINEHFTNLALWLEPWGKGIIFSEVIPLKLTNIYPNSLWRIGIRYDSNNIYLVLGEEFNKQQFLTWELENFICRTIEYFSELKQDVESKLSQFLTHYTINKELVSLFDIKNINLLDKLDKQISQIRNLNHQLSTEQEGSILKIKFTSTQVNDLLKNTHKGLLKLDNEIKNAHKNHEAECRKTRIRF